MRQVLQNLRSGETTLADVPCPMVRAGHLLIQSRASLISAGTERMLVEFGKGGLIAKARAQPDKVRQVLDKIKTDGLMPTLETVFARLDEPLPLGYCNAGVVLDVGAGVEGYSVGDHVVSNGAHAEVVCVPVNLCAKVPDGVASEEAAFTVLSAIALQGIRLIEPTLGERVVVTGLGLIGLVATQLLLANGCRVLGVDLDERKLALAREFGAETVNVGKGGDPVAAATAFSDGRGVDAVLITASAKSNEIVHQAAQMCRKRGRVVLVGVVGLDLKRSDFYEKELSFQVSCSYGPGRYDSSYEDKGQDYPFGFVRWTEQRNFEAILDLMSAGRLKIAPMIERSIPFDEAPGVYDKLSESKNALGLVLQYPDAPDLRRTIAIGSDNAPSTDSGGQAVIGAIGAGNYAKLTLLPAFAKTSAVLRTIASAGGVSARHVGAKFGFQQTTTDYHEILSDASINAVVITTRHNSHARLVIEALEAGKHVFVEKPLALNEEELTRVEAAAANHADLQLFVGFNRRFSPHAVKMASLVAARSEPLTMIMTVNAGFIPPDHWTQDPQVGGGRIIGEGCHWIDLMACLTGSRVERVSASKVGEWKGVGRADDKMTITLSFADGSMGTIHYFANGHKAFPKERLEVFGDGRILAMDNFRMLRGYGFGGFSKLKTPRLDKGHHAETTRFVESVAKGGEPLISLGSIVNTTRASFAALASIESGRSVDVAG